MQKENNQFNVEQVELLNNVHEIKESVKGKGTAWNRFRGDAITKVVAYSLEKHLPKNVKIVRLSWIENCPTEFDLLIVDNDAEFNGFTSAYPKEKVHLLIEVKGSGFFYKKDEVEQKVKELFDKWRNDTGKPVLYFSLWERSSDYAQRMVRAVGKDYTFLIQIKMEINQGEWERFVKAVKSYL